MCAALSENSTVAAAPEQIWCDLGGEAALLHLPRGIYYGLDSVGARVWTLIQTPRSVGEVRDLIVREYDVEADRCERDLLALFAELVAAELIVVVTDQPGR
jgi:hypothetical protein